MIYSRSPKVGNPIASILKSNVLGIPALVVLNPVSNFLGFTIGTNVVLLLKGILGRPTGAYWGPILLTLEKGGSPSLALRPRSLLWVWSLGLGFRVWGLRIRVYVTV